MAVVVCPGVHPPSWTLEFLSQLEAQAPEIRAACLVSPTDVAPPWSPYGLRRFLASQAIAPQTPLIFVAFSAGCVAAMGTAWFWAHQGNTVLAVIQVDGWGVPMAGPFAGYRLSHNTWTHHSSGWLGAGSRSFYADPPVSHPTLWRSPATVTGVQITPTSGHLRKTHTTALEFLVACLRRHPQALTRKRSGLPVADGWAGGCGDGGELN